MDTLSQALTPTHLQAATIAFIAFFGGGLVKGATGFGLPLISVSVLSTFLPIDLALALNVIPPVVLNFWQIGGVQAARSVLTRFWPVLLGIPIGTLIGASILATVDQTRLIGGVGVVILLYCVIEFSGVRLHVSPRTEKPVGTAAGGIAGLTGVLSTINGPPLAMYLLAVRADPWLFRSTLGVIFTIGALLNSMTFATLGFLTWERALMAMACVIPAALGMAAGRRLTATISPERFRLAVLILLVIVGANLLRRAVS